MTLNARSQRTLQGIHPDLVRVVVRAEALMSASDLGFTFIVTDGLRTKEKQAELVRAHKSKTMRSRHLTGHAVDLCALHHDGSVSWDDGELKAIADKMKAAAAELSVRIEWGGDWKGFVDRPHFQLPWKQYPADGSKPNSVTEQPNSVIGEPALEPVAAAPAGPLKTSGTIWEASGRSSPVSAYTSSKHSRRSYRPVLL